MARSIESHIAVKVTEASKALESHLEGLNTKLLAMSGLTMLTIFTGIGAIIVPGTVGIVAR